MHEKDGLPLGEGRAPPPVPAVPLGARCDQCPFAINGRPPHRPVLGVGPVDAIGVLVGEGPGHEEVEGGRPFIGMTGRQLDEELLNAHLARSRLFVVNATCCRPPPSKTENMMRKAVKSCQPALWEQLKRLTPSTPVFAMGKWAHYAMTGEDKGAAAKRGFVDLNFEMKEWMKGPSDD